MAVRITAYFVMANNANAKTIELMFGASAEVSVAATASINSRIRAEYIVTKTATDVQDSSYQVIETTNLFGSSIKGETKSDVASAEDDGAIIIIKGRGTGVATNDIIQEFMLVELLDNSA
jgi:hypothetical protein